MITQVNHSFSISYCLKERKLVLNKRECKSDRPFIEGNVKFARVHFNVLLIIEGRELCVFISMNM